MKRTIEDIDVFEKKVLLRVDFNVPIDENGNILDDSRIKSELPTIKYLLKHNAKIIICSHLGRPDGKRDDKFSLLPIAKYLVNILLCKVHFSPEAIGKIAEERAKNLKPGEILLLENIRFYPEEEKNDPLFCKALASLADVYVNDAFGTAHRKHASTFGVAKLLPNAVGFLMGKEINTITSVINEPERPFVAIFGGAKIADKIPLLDNFINKCNTILIGGGMAFTFLKSKGHEIGKSIVDESSLELCANLLKKAEINKVKIVLPVDFVAGELFSPTTNIFKIKHQNIPANLMAMDIGKKTIKLFKKEIKNAKTILWNGPMGVFEFDSFSRGTNEIATAVTKFKGKAIVGGGDSISAIKKVKNYEKIYHISTGGGASLELMAGGKLPGVEVISEI